MAFVGTVHRAGPARILGRTAALAALSCRIGVLLSLIQVLCWSVLALAGDGVSEELRRNRHAARMDAVGEVISPSLASLAGIDREYSGDGGSDLERSVSGIRETARCMLWGVVLLLLPMVLALGCLTPVLWTPRLRQVLLGAISVFGVLPLAFAEPHPTFLIHQGPPVVTQSTLAGLVAPLVAASLLAAGAVLLDPRRAGPPPSGPPPGGAAMMTPGRGRVSRFGSLPRGPGSGPADREEQRGEEEV